MRPTPHRSPSLSTFLSVALALSLGLSAAAALGGCGSDPKPPPPVVKAPAAPAATAEAATAGVESEIGGMNEEAMVRAFNALGPSIQACVEAGSGRVKPLGGHVTFALRVMKDGAVRWVYLKESTLGDRATEKCLLDEVKAKQWPKPVGGEGLAEKSFDLDPRAAPLTLDEDRTKKSIALVRKEALKCRKGVRGTFLATAYIRTNGQVLAAGVAPPSAKGEDAADCIADVIRRVKFVSPGNKIAKLSFELP